MGYYTSTQFTFSTGNELQAVLQSAFTSAGGWSISGWTFTSTSGGVTTTVDLANANPSTQASPSIYLNGQTRGYFNQVYSAWAGATIKFTVSIDTNFFFLTLLGPPPGQTGAVDASYGSPQVMFCVTGIEPADTVGDTDVDGLQAQIVSHPNTAISQQYATVYQKKNILGTVMSPAELMMDRPAVQDVAAIGDLPTSTKAGVGMFGSRYKVVDNTYGFRGQLKNVAFASEAYALAGDDAALLYAVGSEWWHKGTKYVVCSAAGSGNANSTIQANPFGTSHVIPATSNATGSASGPRLFVKKGVIV
jgi:hypothetical protein